MLEIAFAFVWVRFRFAWFNGMRHRIASFSILNSFEAYLLGNTSIFSPKHRIDSICPDLKRGLL